MQYDLDVLNDFKDVKDFKDFYAMYSFLFPTYAYRKNFSLFVLSLRVLFGVLLMVHGIGKIMDFDTLSQTFPDPLGIGSRWSLILAIFGEAVCSAAFIIGFLHRLCMIPMIITMITAFVVVHKWSVADGEMAFVNLMVFLLLYVVGPGRYSIDRIFADRIERSRVENRRKAKGKRP